MIVAISIKTMIMIVIVMIMGKKKLSRLGRTNAFVESVIMDEEL